MAANSIDFETLSPDPDQGEAEIVASHLEVIETVISSLDQDDSAMVSRSEQGYLWKFKYGTVEVFVQLTGQNDDDTLTVWAPVHQLPVQDEAGLMRHLLKLNCGETFEACFGILNQDIVILANRVLEDINPGEISRLMTIVATIADEQDEVLRAEYP
ncbi:YbjN domain-containing protein [Romeria aff. gracilis LEGE 07310]|uniref:YbjN domain-containing protein n=1 Tax=Vasconcelosia minhoensis LEGE 07310 TaxID=915328 RepID=A0A8J7B163_9CYAN|nr:YbjN domain-containing protein [Romeria gracilis]MBE9080457.1 YbjN domain-containing protein [Romeria aff. gracilis LEGE 07310]